jgi:hypothetical protein
MKKIDFKNVFDRARKIRERSHLSNDASQRDHSSCLVCYLNQEKAFVQCRDLNRNIVKAIDFRINQFFDEETNFKSNSMTIFISIQIFQSTVASFSFSSSIIEINTFFSDFVSTIFSILNSLKRHLELRYRLSFFDSLWARTVRQVRYSELWICDNVKLLYKDRHVDMRRLIVEKISFTSRFLKYSNKILQLLISLQSCWSLYKLNEKRVKFVVSSTFDFLSHCCVNYLFMLCVDKSQCRAF